MKLINSNVEYLSQEEGIKGAYRMAELAGRTCYNSIDKVTENSWNDFIEMLISRNHTSPLEHGAIYLKIPKDYGCPDYFKNNYSRVNKDNDFYYVSTNARVIYENNCQELLRFWVEPTENHIKRVSFRIQCSIGIAMEFTRHRTASFCVESSRYCNYSKDKYGAELTFVKPTWYTTCTSNLGDRMDSYKTSVFENNCQNCENDYLSLIEAGCKPQEAREVLTKAVKTTMIMTAFVDDWEEILKLRLAAGAHPDIQEIAKMIKKSLEDNGFIKKEPRNITLSYSDLYKIIERLDGKEFPDIDTIVEEFYK